jgi:hypothetical protein
MDETAHIYFYVPMLTPRNEPLLSVVIVIYNTSSYSYPSASLGDKEPCYGVRLSV